MNEFRHQRHLSATRAEVFAAIANPDRLARWWGPAGFTNTFEVCDFTPGGVWRFTLHGPDGGNYWNESVFAIIEPDQRIVIDHQSGHRFQLSIDLEPDDRGTLVQWTQTFEDPAEAARIRHIVEPANEQNLDRLEAEAGRDD